MSNVKEITDTDFEQEVFATGQPVLVYFWDTWCGLCKLVGPSVNWIADTYSDRLKVVKLQVDPNPNAVAKCKVEGVPALRLIKDQEIIESHEGAIGKEQLQSLVETFLT